jgi:hypothetical protein
VRLSLLSNAFKLGADSNFGSGGNVEVVFDSLQESWDDAQSVESGAGHGTFHEVC